MSIEQIKDGVDSLFPLYLMIAVLSFIAFIAFTYEPFLKACNKIYRGENELNELIVRHEKGNTRRHSLPPRSLLVLLLIVVVVLPSLDYHTTTSTYVLIIS